MGSAYNDQVLYLEHDSRVRCPYLWLSAAIQDGNFPSSRSIFSSNGCLDLPNYWLGRPTYTCPRRSRLRRWRPSKQTRSSQRGQANQGHIQRLSLRCSSLEVCPSTARSPCSSWRDCARILQGDQQERPRYHWSGHLQCDARAVCAVFQQDPVFLFRRAASQCGRDRGYACVLLPGS